MDKTYARQLQDVYDGMIALYAGDPKRVQHFIKVHDFASVIARREGLSAHERFITELAALVHDIGIHACEEKYGNTSGKYQEFEGPGLAGELLAEVGVDEDITDRVCFLVSKHHTFKDVVGSDWQILLEADMLVNAYEEEMPEAARCAAYENVFKTATGKNLFKQIYAL